MFCEWEKLKPSNEHYGSTTTVIGNLIFLANKQTPDLIICHLQLSLTASLVHWFYWKKLPKQCTAKSGGICWRSTKSQVCILLEFHVDQWHTGVMTQLLSLKLMPAIFFIKFSFFHQMIGLQKLLKMFFISSKKLF